MIPLKLLELEHEINRITAPPVSDQDALLILQAIENYVHERAEEIIAELEQRSRE